MARLPWRRRDLRPPTHPDPSLSLGMTEGDGFILRSRRTAGGELAGIAAVAVGLKEPGGPPWPTPPRSHPRFHPETPPPARRSTPSSPTPPPRSSAGSRTRRRPSAPGGGALSPSDPRGSAAPPT